MGIVGKIVCTDMRCLMDHFKILYVYQLPEEPLIPRPMCLPRPRCATVRKGVVEGGRPVWNPLLAALCRNSRCPDSYKLLPPPARYCVVVNRPVRRDRRGNAGLQMQQALITVVTFLSSARLVPAFRFLANYSC